MGVLKSMFTIGDILLQALCFMETGKTWVPAKPWEASSNGAHISELTLLPAPVQKLLHNLMKED